MPSRSIEQLKSHVTTTASELQATPLQDLVEVLALVRKAETDALKDNESDADQMWRKISVAIMEAAIQARQPWEKT